MGEDIVASRCTDRLKILETRNLHLYLLDLLPQRTHHCAICRRPRTVRHMAVIWHCERCNLPFESRCYWRRVATDRERVLSEVGTDEEFWHVLAFLCHGCRS